MPEEVEDGLLDMMRHDLGLENRLDLGLRMYQHLYDTIEKLNFNRRNWVVQRLVFPLNWHTRVQANSYLEPIYRHANGNYSTYTWDGWELVQGRGAHRFNRNASEHGLEKSVDLVMKKAMYTRSEIAIMLYAIFPLLLHSLMRALDRLGKIREIEVESLFVYHRDA
ncbi:unnamed protein product [Urochloa humidicola]